MNSHSSPEYLSWNDFNLAIDKWYSQNEIISRGLLDLILECRKIIQDMIDFVNNSNNDDKYIFDVVLRMLFQSFRVCISAIKLSLSGYPDTASFYVRTLMEIKMWLFRIKEDPGNAFFGYIIFNLLNDIRLKKNILANASEPEKESLNHEIELLESDLGNLERDISSRGLDYEYIKKRYIGNGRNTPIQEDLKNEYFKKERNTRFKAYCNVIHAGDYIWPLYTENPSGELITLKAGPVNIGCLECMREIFGDFTKILLMTAIIVGQENFIEAIKGVRKQASAAWDKIHRRNSSSDMFL